MSENEKVEGKSQQVYNVQLRQPKEKTKRSIDPTTYNLHMWNHGVIMNYS